MYSDDGDIYFKHFMGQYTPMEGKLINAIKSLELRISELERKNKVGCDTTYVIKGEHI